MTTIKFTTKSGEQLEGKLVRSYFAFEGDKRYIVEANGRQYRLTKTEDGYYEYVV